MVFAVWAATAANIPIVGFSSHYRMPVKQAVAREPFFD